MRIRESNEHPYAVSGGVPHCVREPEQYRRRDLRLLTQQSLETVNQDHLVAARIQCCLDRADHGRAGKFDSQQQVSVQRRRFLDRPGDQHAVDARARGVGKPLGELAHLVTAAHPTGDAGRKIAAGFVVLL